MLGLWDDDLESFKCFKILRVVGDEGNAKFQRGTGDHRVGKTGAPCSLLLLLPHHFSPSQGDIAIERHNLAGFQNLKNRETFLRIMCAGEKLHEGKSTDSERRKLTRAFNEFIFPLNH